MAPSGVCCKAGDATPPSQNAVGRLPLAREFSYVVDRELVFCMTDVFSFDKLLDAPSQLRHEYVSGVGRGHSVPAVAPRQPC